MRRMPVIRYIGYIAMNKIIDKRKRKEKKSKKNERGASKEKEEEKKKKTQRIKTSMRGETSVDRVWAWY